jgi:hypothetical protein
VLCRRPTPVECEAFVRFWEEDRTERSQQGTADPAQEALAEVCRGIFNLNEFYYPD